MTWKERWNLLARGKHAAARFATVSLAALTLLIPVGAIPARKSTVLLHRAVLAAPRLPRLSHGGEYWHTERNRILDGHNHEIRIAGVNWSGFETRRAVPGGLTLQDYHQILRIIQQQGYNTVRLPLSNEMVESPTVPDEIAYTIDGETSNADLRGLNSLQILDKIIAAAGSTGLKVILDDHRSEAGDSAEASGLWYTPDYSEEAWINDWVMLAKRYRNNPTVIGMDLRNEPHNASSTGACWDCGGDRDWHAAATRAGNAVLRTNSKLLIFVEGVDTYAGESSWWGGNLMGVRHSPVRLAVPNRLVYSAHVYGPTEYHQAWFNEATSAISLRALWRRQWAFVSETEVAPVWIGEFGTPNMDADVQSSEPGSEGQWFSELVRFLHDEPSLQWTYWGINGEDRYGLLDARYEPRPANGLKADALATILPGRLDVTRRPPVTVTSPPSAATPEMKIIAAAPDAVAPMPVASFAQAAREEVEQRLYSAGADRPGAPDIAVPAEAPATRSARLARPASPEPRQSQAQVNTAVADDVQKAIAAAMSAQTAASAKH